MEKVSKEQIPLFRLHMHYLNTWYQKADAENIIDACGFQNSPPGACEIALHNRIPDCKQKNMKQMLEDEKILLQVWGFRGAPVVFPTSESDIFLSALVPKGNELWI